MKYRMTHAYDGTAWDNRDLHRLQSLADSGATMRQIADELGRSVAACTVRYREIRRMQMMASDDPNETLHSWKKKLTEATKDHPVNDKINQGNQITIN